MTEVPENEEARLRQQYLGRVLPGDPDPAPRADEAVRQALRTANVQTGFRDVVVLAVSSFFAALLVLFAPVAMRSHRARVEKPIDKTDADG